MTNKTDFDVIIVGGGLVGASLAISLARTSMRIALVEAWPFNAPQQPSYDDRAIALAYGSRLILEGMSIWPQLAPLAEPICRIHISDRGNFGFTRLNHLEQQVDALGYVVTAHTLGKVMLRELEHQARLRLYCPATLASFQNSDDAVTANISINGRRESIRGKLLVAADGIRSMVRRSLGIGVREWSYGQTAVICNLTPGVASNGTAYERFTDSGPMAMLPLPERRYGLVWTVENRMLDAVMKLDDVRFIAAVQERFGFRLGRLSRPGNRSSYPLKLVKAREHVRPRIALIGNAAHAVHPITGQGFNLGIRDVAALVDVLSEAYGDGEDIGSMSLLEHYARWRHTDQWAVALATDGLVRLFGNPLLPIRVARNLGMLGLDTLPFARRSITRRFMGLSGRLPRLSRGLPVE